MLFLVKIHSLSLWDELLREVRSKLGRVQRSPRNKQHLYFQGRWMLRGYRGSKGLAMFCHPFLRLRTVDIRKL